MTVNLIPFYILALAAILSAAGVVFSPNAVRSALCLVGTFFALAMLYFTLGAEAVGITQIVVYAGAIMVLFLFVIMLLNLSAGEKLAERRDAKKWAAGLLGVGLAVFVSWQIFQPLLAYNPPNAPNGWGAFPRIGFALFTDYGYVLESVSVLLLIGIVGSILLAKRRLR